MLISVQIDFFFFLFVFHCNSDNNANYPLFRFNGTLDHSDQRLKTRNFFELLRNFSETSRTRDLDKTFRSAVA